MWAGRPAGRAIIMLLCPAIPASPGRLGLGAAGSSAGPAPTEYKGMERMHLFIPLYSDSERPGLGTTEVGPPPGPPAPNWPQAHWQWPGPPLSGRRPDSGRARGRGVGLGRQLSGQWPGQGAPPAAAHGTPRRLSSLATGTCAQRRRGAPAGPPVERTLGTLRGIPACQDSSLR
jgi:hypothetical protein